MQCISPNNLNAIVGCGHSQELNDGQHVTGHAVPHEVPSRSHPHIANNPNATSAHGLHKKNVVVVWKGHMCCMMCTLVFIYKMNAVQKWSEIEAGATSSSVSHLSNSIDDDGCVPESGQ